MTKDELILRIEKHMQSDPKEWTFDDLNFMSVMVNVIDTELKATGSVDEMKQVITQLTPARQEWAGELIDTFVQLLQKPAKELQL